MAEYPSNSNKVKSRVSEEVRQIQPVVQHETSSKPASPVQKFAELFSVEDFKSVRKYVTQELLIPSLKKIFLNALSMWLKTSPTGAVAKTNSTTSSVTYAQYLQPKQQAPAVSTIRSTDYPDFGQVIFKDIGDAERVRTELNNLLKIYPVVRISDYYELANLPAPYTGNRYGWTNFNEIDIVRVNTQDGPGYTLNMPKAFVLD